jgi:hypothetical protein
VTKDSLREHPAGHAYIVEAGAAPRKVDIGTAEAAGYTVVDLSDDWVPFIFSDKTPGRDDARPNEYRARYVDLANDRVDDDGVALRAHQHNYLELYGIPPTLGVVATEWEELGQSVDTCLTAAGWDPTALRDFDGVIPFERAKERRWIGPARWARADLEKQMRKAKLDPSAPGAMEAAADDPRTRNAWRAWRKAQVPLDVIVAAQKRLRCERLYERAGGQGTFDEGAFDFETSLALAAFEKKHDIKGWGHFTRENTAVLALSPAETIHARLLRVFEERVVSAAGIVEDGSAARWRTKLRWKDSAGQEQPLRDLVGEARAAIIAALDLATPESARASLARLRELGGGSFERLLVAVRLPPRPEYYSDRMELEAVIDRGDVWYDLPFDAQGRRLAQPRKHYPHLTIYVRWRDQKIPLVHWRTTIGSWRRELENGTIVYKYKNSDVGPRVWKQIFAGPSWIPPDTTPPDELLKRRWVDGAVRTVVNYDEIGPGFRSAYGLVAAYHVREVFDSAGAFKADLDNQIRTHGSVDYMSILRRFSHGCHRLYNMDAVRMFSFVLRHSEYTREGQRPVGYRRSFDHEGESYKLKVETRGYEYVLTRPIPVMVTEGTVRGSLKKPIEDAVPLPAPPDAAGDPAAGASPEPPP